MSRITGTDAYDLMEAYNAVYASQEQIELTEEQIWEEVETWVNSLLEEGYDLSEYTWEEMYEAYIGENTGQRIGAGIRDVIGSNWRGLTGRQTSSTNPLSRATNAVGRAVSAPVRAGINYTGAVTQGYAGQRTTSRNPISQAANAVTRNVSGVVRGLVTGDSGDSKKPAPKPERQGPIVPDRIKNASPTPAPSKPAAPPAPVRPAGGPPRPTRTPGGGKVAPTAASRPTAAAQTGDKAKDMATFAKANPGLAAAAAEKARIRGTQQTDNPLMKSMRSRLPMNSPSVQAPAVAGLGKGNQSLSQNPNAFKAAPPKPAATSTAPEVKATNTAAATPKPTPVAPSLQQSIRNRRLNMEMEYDAFDLVLEYLLSQGHTDTVDEALYVMMEMDSETIQSICEAYQTPRFKRKHYLQKLSKRGGMGTGDPGDPLGYRDPKMAKVGAELVARTTAARRAQQTGEPDTYQKEREEKAAANRARGAAKRGEG